jgi:hypothetical protein
VYILAVNAKNAGQDFIPVHVFPVKFGNVRSMDYLNNFALKDNSAEKLWSDLKGAYDYFEAHHKLPVILVDEKGKYIM